MKKKTIKLAVYERQFIINLFYSVLIRNTCELKPTNVTVKMYIYPTDDQSVLTAH